MTGSEVLYPGMISFRKLVDRLARFYVKVEAPPAKGPFELVMWENACYLLPDERRREVFEGLREKVGMTAAAIGNASHEDLMALAVRGGMRPDTRVFRWREIARITEQQFAGNLNSILQQSYAEARRALKQYPNIGEPGAEKILLFCGVAQGLPLESNGLRVLVRVGWGRQQKNYGAMYRTVQENLKPELPADADRLKEAFLLLREHGKVLCKDKTPVCSECPLAAGCDDAMERVASFLGPE